jgi:hypothetical protein
MAKRYAQLLRSGDLKSCLAFLAPRWDHNRSQAYKRITMHTAQYRT